MQTLTIEVSAHFSLITMSLKCAICGEMKVKHGPNGFYPSEWKKWSEGTSRCKPCYDAQELSGTSEAGLTCSMCGNNKTKHFFNDKQWAKWNTVDAPTATCRDCNREHDAGGHTGVCGYCKEAKPSSGFNKTQWGLLETDPEKALCKECNQKHLCVGCNHRFHTPDTIDSIHPTLIKTS